MRKQGKAEGVAGRIDSRTARKSEMMGDREWFDARIALTAGSSKGGKHDVKRTVAFREGRTSRYAGEGVTDQLHSGNKSRKPMALRDFVRYEDDAGGGPDAIERAVHHLLEFLGDDWHLRDLQNFQGAF